MKTKKIIAILFVFALLVIAGGHSPYNLNAQTGNTELVVDANTEALWHFNNDWTDESTNAHDGTAYNGATFTASSRFGSHAADFDGDAYSEVSNIDFSGDVSFSGWIYQTDNSVNRIIISRSNYCATGIRGWTPFSLGVNTDGKLTYHISTTSSCSTGFTQDVYKTDNNVITQNTWHHVALTVDDNGTVGRVVTFYVDGVVAASTEVYSQDGAFVQDGTQVTRIGSCLQAGGNCTADMYGSFQSFLGRIDEVEISNSIYSANTVEEYYLAGAVRDQTGIEVNIADVIALDCGADVDFGTVTPGTPVTAETTCTATTNAENGYTLQVKREDADTTMDHTTDATANITDKAAWTSGSPNATTAIDDVLGFGVYASTATKNTTWWGTGTACDDASNNYAGFPSDYDTIMSHSTYSATGTTTSVCYKVDLPSSQKSGSYDGVVVYQVYTNP